MEREGYTSTLQKLLDEIDLKFATMRLDAERQCEKIQSYPWSPKLRNAKRNVTYWKIWISELRVGRDFSSQRLCIRQEQLPNRPTQEQANKELRIAQRELRDALRNASELRKSHLLDRSSMAQIEGNDSDAQAIARIMRAEDQRARFARLRIIMKGSNYGALNHILVEDSEGKSRPVHDQEEINDLLKQRNANHFSQADGTPFTYI